MPRFRRLRLLPALSIVATVALLALPGAALADCMAPPPVEEAAKTAAIVFVGTVTETTNRNSWAAVTVEEVWRGPDLPASVVIKGGPEGNAATSVDRTFEVGVRYLFFPYGEEDNALPGRGGLADNSCTNTTPWTEDMVALRPADVRQPIGANPAAEQGFDPASLLPIAVVGIVFAVLLGVGLLARGRQEA